MASRIIIVLGRSGTVNRRNHAPGVAGLAVDRRRSRPDRNPVVASRGNTIGTVTGITSTSSQTDRAIDVISAGANIGMAIVTTIIKMINIELRATSIKQVDAVRI